MKKNKGFTLIELLVVIAIIGILASVVLAALSSARSKGSDAAIKADLANARAQGELFYSDNGNSYNGGAAASDVCNTLGVAGTTKGIFLLVDGARVASGATTTSTSSGGTAAIAEVATTAYCSSTASAWAAQAPLKSTAGTYWCVDSTGASLQEGTAAVAGATKCV